MKDATPLKARKPWTGRQWAHFLDDGWTRRATNAWRRTVLVIADGRRRQVNSPWRSSLYKVRQRRSRKDTKGPFFKARV